MKRRHTTAIIGIACLLVSGIAFSFTPTLLKRPEGLEKKHISDIMAGALQLHVREKVLTPDIAEATLSNYVEILDYGKVFLLKDDVDDIMANKATFMQSFQNEDWDFITKAYDAFLNRVDLQHTYAMEYLSQTNLQLDETREIIISRDDREYPKTEKDAKKLLEDNLQYQLAYLVSLGEPLTGAVQKVIKRRERLKKRFHDMDRSEQLALFLNSFCLALDPHSSYFSKEDMEDFNISMNLSLEGIGALLGQTEGITEIKSLTPGGPAEKSGLVEPGDKIVAVAQEDGNYVDIIDMELKDVVRYIRGKKGTKVTLKIVRKTAEGNERKDITLTREEVKLEDQAAQLEIVDLAYTNANGEASTDRIGVIDLPSFYLDSDRVSLFSAEVKRSSVQDMRKLLTTCVQSNVAGVVLALHRNGGGALEEAVDVAGLFMKEANVVFADFRRSPDEVLADRDKDIVFDGPVVVSISRMTASGAEIVAGALQDYRRAVLVGDDHTYGKGSVQRVIPLSKALGALKITVGEYFLASGRSPQEKGVFADVVVPSELSALEIGEKYQKYVLPSRFVKPQLTSKNATGAAGKGWMQISGEEIAKLSEESKTRIMSAADFAIVQTNIIKITEEREKKTISIGEVLAEAETNLTEKITNDIVDSSRERSITNDVLITECLNVMRDILRESATDATPHKATAPAMVKRENEKTTRMKKALE